MFSREFCEISKKTFSCRTPSVAASSFVRNTSWQMKLIGEMLDFIQGFSLKALPLPLAAFDRTVTCPGRMSNLENKLVS